MKGVIKEELFSGKTERRWGLACVRC